MGTKAQTERDAIGLYAVLARDVCDFMEMCVESDDATLALLNQLLTTPNPKHDRDTRETNRLGAQLVSNIIAGRAEGRS